MRRRSPRSTTAARRGRALVGAVLVGLVAIGALAVSRDHGDEPPATASGPGERPAWKSPPELTKAEPTITHGLTSPGPNAVPAIALRPALAHVPVTGTGSDGASDGGSDPEDCPEDCPNCGGSSDPADPVPTTTVLRAEGRPTTYVATVTDPVGDPVCAGVVEFVDTVTGWSTIVRPTPTLDGCEYTLTTDDAVGHPVTATFEPFPACAYLGSTSDPVTVQPPGPGLLTLTADPVTGPAYSTVTLDAELTGPTTGTVQFWADEMLLGTVPVGGPLILTTNTLGFGYYHLVAVLVVDGREVLRSNVVLATYGEAVDPQYVAVSVPFGTLTITSPYTPESPLDLGTAVLDPATSTFSAGTAFRGIVVTDTRAGEPGFAVSVGATALTSPGGTIPATHLGLVDVAAVQFPGNAMQADDLTVTDAPALAPGPTGAHALATYPARHPLGTVGLEAWLRLAEVPTSSPPGRYTTTVTFTAV